MSYLNDINKVALRRQWKDFRRECEVPVTDKENEFLWKLRNLRNDHQHGKTAFIDRADVDRASNVIEKAVVALLQRL